MGSMQVMEMAEQVKEGSVDLETAVRWQLEYNSYPPIPLCMIEPCVAAIENAKVGEWDKLVDLPEGVLYKGRHQATVEQVVTGHHLGVFVDG